MFMDFVSPEVSVGNNPIQTVQSVTQSTITQGLVSIALRNQFVWKFFMNKPGNDAIENSAVLNNIAIN